MGNKKMKICKRKFRVEKFPVTPLSSRTTFAVTSLVMISIIISGCASISDKGQIDVDARIEQTVKMQDVSGYWLVPVNIDGVELKLILDTGAIGTTLFENENTAMFFRDSADSKGIRRLDGSNRVINTKTFAGASLAVGGLRKYKENLTLLSKNQSPMHPWDRDKIDGAIGFSLLNKYDIKIDNLASEITFLGPGALAQSEFPNSFGFKVRDKVPSFTVNLSFGNDIDIKGARAWIDTGANTDVRIINNIVRDEWINTSAKKVYVKTASGLETYFKTKPVLLSAEGGGFSKEVSGSIRRSLKGKTSVIIGRPALMDDIIEISYKSGFIRTISEEN